MAINQIKPSFTKGELSPSILGRTDLAAWQIGCSVCRNAFVSYRGPISSRAGTAFVGQSLTPASAASLPPRLIRFQYSIYQSYILEFGADATGRKYMRVIANGAYVTDTPQAITNATQANPAALTVDANGYTSGDWVFLTGIQGMTQLNNRTAVVANASVNAFNLQDTFGAPIDSLNYTAYTAGGTAARIFTNYDPPYALEDLPYLKVVQSADVMSLCCVNQQTGTEYPPIDLARLAANNWTFTETTFASAIAAPATCIATASTTGGANPTQYAYCVTAVDAATGEESVASPVAYILDSVNIALTAGSHTIIWAGVPGAASYNVYQAPPSYDTAVPAGSVFAYIGQSFGTEFVNSNIQADQTKTPPQHINPFARGSIIGATITNGGAGYTQSTATITVNTTTGTGAVLVPVVVGGAVVAVIVQNGGENYAPTDTISINGQTLGSGAAATFTATPTDGAIETITVTNGGTGYVSPVVTAPIGTGAAFVPVTANGVITAIYLSNAGTNYVSGSLTINDTVLPGSGATATLQVGPASGTYPGVVAYFQSRRAYAYTINNPDTEFFSQTGAYQNMDSATPPIDSDAIVTTPWGQQVNGIQWMIPMPGGLISATGLDAWQITGAGGAGTPLTPSSQSAQAQESNGFSPTVRPIKIDSDILYVQSLGYTVRDIQYNFFNNIYASQDVSILSNHLFEGFQITQWGWAKIPWKIVWATRNDGKFLSLTFDKQEQLQGWGRHDTNGLVVGNEVATEPPVDAPYFVVKRYIIGAMRWAYYIERMDNRLWQGPEDPWCVDAGLALTQPAPNATLSAAAAEGPGSITGGYLATGGSGYTTPVANVVDPLGLGSGAVISLTVVGGEITAFAIDAAGADYSPGTQIVISDPAGAGATIVPFVSQNVLFDASAAVFTGTAVGDVIRIGGGQATVSSINSPTQVLAAVTVPILQTMPNDPYRLPVPAPAGAWSITTPVSSLTNLFHLEGMTVTGLADGAVIPPVTVTDGTVTLDTPASSIKIGLPFIVQMQAMPSEVAQMGTIQGKRKQISGVNLRMEKTKGCQIGADQPVASMLDFQQEIPWDNLVDLPEVPNVNAPAAALPLFTGDKFAPINSDWQGWNGWESAYGMPCVQQLLPLPLNVLALVTNLQVGDT